jgi:hypothetical protein
MSIRLAALTVLTAMICVPPAIAQEPAPSPPAAAGQSINRKFPAPVPLKVTVVLSRSQGEKRISSMPYVLGVMSSGYGPAQKTTLRMGVEVPVATVKIAGDGKAAPVSSYNYRDVGTNIDCGASFEESNPGVFRLALTVADSSLGLDTPKSAGSAASSVLSDVPTFRNFNSSFTALLRDGQTMQYTSATDPVTGEVMKIDVSVAVMK